MAHGSNSNAGPIKWFLLFVLISCISWAGVWAGPPVTTEFGILDILASYLWSGGNLRCVNHLQAFQSNLTFTILSFFVLLSGSLATNVPLSSSGSVQQCLPATGCCTEPKQKKSRPDCLKQ